MKFICRCGHSIVDADESPHKAWLSSDQDMEWLRISVHGGGDPLRVARPVYHCTNCGRLAFRDPVDDSRMLFFSADERTAYSPLGSILGDDWPVRLVGGWKDWLSPPRGDLFWGTSGTRPGGFEEFDNLEALRARYFEVLEQLRREDRLDSAWLHRGEETLHSCSG